MKHAPGDEKYQPSLQKSGYFLGNLLLHLRRQANANFNCQDKTNCIFSKSMEPSAILSSWSWCASATCVFIFCAAVSSKKSYSLSLGAHLLPAIKSHFELALCGDSRTARNYPRSLVSALSHLSLADFSKRHHLTFVAVRASWN